MSTKAERDKKAEVNFTGKRQRFAPTRHRLGIFGYCWGCQTARGIFFKVSY